MMTTMMMKMMMMMMMRSLWPTKLDSTIQIPLSPSSHVKNNIKTDNVVHMHFQLLTTDKQTDFAYEQPKDLLEVCFDQHISSCCCHYHLQ